MTKRRSAQKRRRKTSNQNKLPPILAVVGRSRSGKTRLVESLIRALTKKGYAVGTVKDAKGGFQLDLEGKDSAKHYRAGAQGVVIVSAQQKEVAFIAHLEEDLSVTELCERFFPDVDLILLEGFKDLPVPKIETTCGESLYCGNDATLAAVVGQASNPPDNVPCFSFEDIPVLVQLIERTLGLSAPEQRDRPA